MIEPFLSVVKRYAHSPHWSPPVDDFIRQMEPRVSWRRRMLSRARQCSFRRGSATMVAVLGAAMAFGWLLVKIAKPSDSNR